MSPHLWAKYPSIWPLVLSFEASSKIRNSAMLPFRKSEVSLCAPMRMPLDKLDVPGFKLVTLVPSRDKELLDELNTAVITK